MTTNKISRREGKLYYHYNFLAKGIIDHQFDSNNIITMINCYYHDSK